MQLTIRSTDEVAILDGVAARVWEGVTAGGVPCKLFVHRLQVDSAHFDTAEFDAHLMEQPSPTELLESIGGWLCQCGQWNDHEFHCDKCGFEPPWGCSCDAHDGDEGEKRV